MHSPVQCEPVADFLHVSVGLVFHHAQHSAQMSSGLGFGDAQVEASIAELEGQLDGAKEHGRALVPPASLHYCCR